ncbi:MAG: cyclic nucleotide-binding domain-containing protein, partial [Desulfocapsaceae bacterium]|nr:cyclic nucleotide-binding domain-containing protein [Desulfocapsaceae bacterium]
IIEEDFQDLLEIVSGILLQWLQAEDEFVAGFEPVCLQLQKIILKLLYSQQWQTVENHVFVLQRITTGEIEKSNLIRGVSAKLYENLAEPDIIDNLVKVYLDENDDRRGVAENLLIYFGRFAAMFLVQKMIYSSSREERFALIEMIPRVGEVTVPVLVACLEDKPQWFVIRNVIFIISRLGDPELYSVVEPYLTYSDIRVQQQVVSCIEMLGGTRMRERLVSALMTVNDELKGQIINQLGQYSDSDVGKAYLSLLENRKSIARHIQDDLVLKLCIRIRYLPSSGRAVSCLRNLLQERREKYGAEDRIAVEASSTLQALEVGSESGPASNAAAEEVVTADDAVPEGSEDEATALFSSDEMDNMSSGGDISGILSGSAHDEETEKSRENTPDIPGPVSRQQHLMIWSKLYELMNEDEADLFFSILKARIYITDEEIVNRGDAATDLFFIDSGLAGLSYVDDGKSEIFLTSLQAGDVIGSGGLTEKLAWTVSLSAQTNLQVRILDQDGYIRFAEQFPELSERLLDYCNHHDVLPYLINQTENKALQPINEDIAVTTPAPLFLDSSGEAVEDAGAGSLQFIACGGYCFTLPYVHKDNAEAVLGLQVVSHLQLSDGEGKNCFGVIAGAGSHSRDDRGLFIYVRFYHPLNSADYGCPAVDII